MAAEAKTNEELIECLQAVDEDTQYAKNILTMLWEQNKRLVWVTIHRLTGLSDFDEGFEDMRQQSFFGLRAAAYAYDPSSGVKFSTYAVKRIRWELTRYYEHYGFTVRIPAFMKKRLRDCIEKKRELEAETNCPVTYAAALEKMGFSPVVIAGTLAAFRKLETSSIDEIINSEKDGDGVSLLDVTAAADNVEEAVLSQEWLKELHNTLIAALCDIPSDAYNLIIRHYFQNVPLIQIAEEQGLSRQTLYNREAAAFQAIRTGKYGTVLAEFMPSHNSYKRAQRLIKQDREAIEQLRLSDTERNLLIL